MGCACTYCWSIFVLFTCFSPPFRVCYCHFFLGSNPLRHIQGWWRDRFPSAAISRSPGMAQTHNADLSYQIIVTLLPQKLPIEDEMLRLPLVQKLRSLGAGEAHAYPENNNPEENEVDGADNDAAFAGSASRLETLLPFLSISLTHSLTHMFSTHSSHRLILLVPYAPINSIYFMACLNMLYAWSWFIDALMLPPTTRKIAIWPKSVRLPTLEVKKQVCYHKNCQLRFLLDSLRMMRLNTLVFFGCFLYYWMI